MPTQEELYSALRQAHAAGDTAAATRLADYIRSQNTETPSTASVALSGVNRGLAGMLDTVANAPVNTLNLGKAAIGAGLYATGNQGAADRLGFTDMTEQPSPAARTIKALGIGQVQPVTPIQKRVDWAAQALPGALLNPVSGAANIAKSIGMNALSGVASGEAYERTGSPAASILAGALAPMAAEGALAARSAAAEKSALANSLKRQQASEAMDSGYVIPPTTTTPGLTNTIFEGYAGKIKTAQRASEKNQPITNAKAARSLGLPDDAPLTPETLTNIRNEAGKSYEAVKAAGRITSDNQFISELDNIKSQFEGAARDFPELARPEVSSLVDSLKRPDFDAGSAVDAIRILRDKADAAYAGGDKALGKAAKGAANALEGAIERHLSATNQQSLLKDFRDSRQLIAKTYTVQNVMNPATGNVNAQKLATQLQKGKPLSGGLLEVAKFGAAFPKAAQEIRDSVPAISPLDYAASGATAAGSGNPLPLLHILTRPGAREMILSKPYQSMMINTDLPSGLSPQQIYAEALARMPELAGTGAFAAAIQDQNRKNRGK